MLKSLSGRFLMLTVAFVMLAEVLIFVPSVARFRLDYLQLRLERAQIASLVLLAADEITDDLSLELLNTAEVYNVVLMRDDLRQLVLSKPLPEAIATYDLRAAAPHHLIWDAFATLARTGNEIVRVIGDPVQGAGPMIEITIDTAPMRAAMIAYGLRILALSLVISVISAALLYLALGSLMVRPIQRLVRRIELYARDPTDPRHIIEPGARTTELRQAEMALAAMQGELTQALRQKGRLEQLGGAVARVSHDLRNILSSAQLFTDRIEASRDPVVQRLTPKLVGSIRRAVHLCESTLAFGRAEEPAPTMTLFHLAPVVDEVFESEALARGGAKVAFVNDVPEALSLRADPEQLFRVLSNLVRNSRQALERAGRGGEVRVSARELEHQWVVRVSDTGPGLPEKLRENVFKPFAAGRGKGGSGLGLAIAAELVKGHGGTLALDDTSANEGAAFIIHLPTQADTV